MMKWLAPLLIAAMPSVAFAQAPDALHEVQRAYQAFLAAEIQLGEARVHLGDALNKLAAENGELKKKLAEQDKAPAKPGP